MTAVSETGARVSVPPRPAVLSGVDTLVRLLMLRHDLDKRDGLTTATMVSGYPGSPLGAFDLALEAAGGQALAAHRIRHQPGLNEELAAAIVWGSQMGGVIPYDDVDGVAGAWYGKGPGLDRSGDVLKHANSMGAGPNGGAVAFCGDDPAAKSSTLACDSQYTFQDACIPVLYPGDQQDVLDLGVHAFRMSRYAGSWVGLKIVTSVADGIGTVDPDPARHVRPDLSDVLVEGRPWHHQPLATVGAHAVPDQEALVLVRRLAAAQAYARRAGLDRVVGAAAPAPNGTAPLGVVCAGKTYLDVLEAFSLDELAAAGVRVLKLGMTYPLVTDTILEFAASVDELVVIEEKRPFIETQLRAILHENGSLVPVAGKRDRSGQPLASSVGELDARAVTSIFAKVRPALGARAASGALPAGAVSAGAVSARAVPAGAAPAGTRTALPLLALPAVDLPGRPPGYCSGCPHNRSTLVPPGALAGGGVGCHGIMYFEARQSATKSLPPPPMGAEGIPWLGLAPFVSEPHVIQNLGDGTLSHSGTLAIRASVAARANITFKILYNAAVAMTGGQDVTGLMDVPALTRALEAEGITKVVVCAEDPRHYGRRARWARATEVLGRDRLPEVQERLRKAPGVTVIIYDQRCAAQSRRLRKRGQLAEPPRRVFINEAVCEGCGDCGVKSNCLSVLPLPTEFGDKRQIHDPSCNRDYTCLEGDCPSFVTIKPASRAGRIGKRVAARAATSEAASRAAHPAGSLPVPPVPAVSRRYSIYFTGIGGTGVVTANRIIAAAADVAGFYVGGLDQTGLSQKAGAVVSHLHLARSRDDLGAASVDAGSADLYLSGDILQAAAARHLEKIRPGQTIAVIDRDVTPTSAMLQRDLTVPDAATLEQVVTARTSAGRAVFLDAKRIAETAFGDHLFANVILLGAAFQLGGLPVTLDDIEEAMSQQGGAAAANRAAFEWGRWAVHDQEATGKALTAGGVSERPTASVFDPSAAALATASGLVAARQPPGELRDLLTRRAAQAIDYQDARLAGRFLNLVQRVAAGDDAGRGWALTRAVAESWFKLATYKDEYEVARLHLAADYREAARDLGIEGPFAVTYHLHPPILRRLGMRKKLPLGTPYALAFRLLRPMKRLRGTPFDVFGWDRDRRTERAVIGEYERLMSETIAAGLPYDTLVRLAESAQSVKGYGPVKEAAVTAWRERVSELRTRPAVTTRGARRP